MTTDKSAPFVEASPGRPLTSDPAVQLRLDLLRVEWDSSYVIWFQAGDFYAMRRDNGARCPRASAEDLRREIDADHRARPVFIA